jgi:hypothetical protein
MKDRPREKERSRPPTAEKMRRPPTPAEEKGPPPLSLEFPFGLNIFVLAYSYRLEYFWSGMFLLSGCFILEIFLPPGYFVLKYSYRLE